jgi:hypothetical protein
MIFMQEPVSPLIFHEPLKAVRPKDKQKLHAGIGLFFGGDQCPHIISLSA